MLAAIATAMLAAGQGGVGPLALELPVACTPGRNCWIQKYADLAAGPDRRDYRCGAVTTDGHDGVDFRIASLADMRRGVPVLAAAPGTVLRVRDGEPDVSVKDRGPTPKEAGNGVVIDHGNGWETQYSHLRQGSVRVRPGDRVAAGTPIGLVGLSGNTEYPHLHFSVRRAGAKVDPFTASPLPGACGANAGRGLWSAAAIAKLPYRTAQVARLAITTAPQPAPMIGDPPAPSRQDPLVLVADVIAPEAGDGYRFELVDPAGKQILVREGLVERPHLAWSAYAGRKAPAGGWASGRYAGKLSLIRNGREIARSETGVTVR